MQTKHSSGNSSSELSDSIGNNALQWGSMQGSHQPMAELNITPLVDVVLVLLIVFMISAPLMQEGIDVNLPKTRSGALSTNSEQVLVTIDTAQRISIARQNIPKGKLRETIKAILAAKPQMQVIVRADQAVPYGVVAQVMAEVKNAGVNRIGLATEPGLQN